MKLSRYLLLCFVSGCGVTPSMPTLRLKLRQGQLAEACEGAQQRMKNTDSQAADRLHAARLWVKCESRRGGLARVAMAFAGQDDGLALYARALALIAADPGALDSASGLLFQAAKRWPRASEIPFRHGLLLLADSKPKRALPLLERACRMRPNPRCQMTLGHALVDLGRPRAGIKAAEAALSMQPSSADIRRGQALVRRLVRRDRVIPAAARTPFAAARRLLLAQKRPAAALRALQQLLVDFPGVESAHVLVGLAHLRLDNGALALVALQKAARKEAYDPTAPFLLGTLYETRRQLVRAARHYRQALERDPFSVQAASRLAMVERRRGDHRAAAKVYARLALLTPQHAVLREAGRAHLKAGLWGEAEQYYADVLAAEPDDFEAHLRLAQLLLRQLQGRGDPSLLRRARRHAARAARVRPKDREVQRALDALSKQ